MQEHSTFEVDELHNQVQGMPKKAVCPLQPEQGISK